MLKLPIYLDYNATTPCDPRVVEAMMPYFSKYFGNAASRSHSFGWQAEEAVSVAREQVAELIGAIPTEIVFTSGATESNNLAIKGVFEAFALKGHHIITTNIEHKAVLDVCKYLEKKGAGVTYLPVNGEGLVTAEQIKDAITPVTVLIAVMFANNEIGTMNPIREIGAIAREHNVLLFTDGAQAVGKFPVSVNEDNIDIMSLSSHKMYGPKGVGALYVRRRNPRVKLIAQLHGGGHEREMRSGTLNVPGIVGFGKACRIACDEMAGNVHMMNELRNKLESALLSLEDVYVNGNTRHRLPNISNLSFGRVEGQALMMQLNKDIAVSSGSACTSASLEPSYVLRALGMEDELAHSSIRFSLGRMTTEEEIDFTIGKVKDVVGSLRKFV